MSPQETASLEKRKLHHELEAQCLRADILKNNYENNLRILSLSSNSPTHFSNQINSIESFVKKSEQNYLFKRNLKLSKLITEKSLNYTKTKILNLTNIIIPNEIQELLELGPNHSIGGYVRHEGSEIFLGLDSLFNKFKSEARKNGINELTIEKVRCNIMLTGSKLSICNTKDTKIEKFLKFKRDNSDLIFLKCDKSNNICLMAKTQYFSKMENLFQNDAEFLKINNFNLEETMKDFKHLLKTTINPSLGNISKLSIKPQSSISSLYGTVKDHKQNFPLRPIGTAYDSLTLGAEEYISNIFAPLRKNCTYAIKSQIEFKQKILQIRPDFDPAKHEIFSLDVNSLFPNINNTRVINYILTEVFKDPKLYFFEKDKKGYTLPVPTREKLRKFLHGVLNNFNIFNCHIGIFSQRKGVKMGSPHSSLFADLFLGILERTVVSKLERQGHVLK